MCACTTLVCLSVWWNFWPWNGASSTRRICMNKACARGYIIRVWPRALSCASACCVFVRKSPVSIKLWLNFPFIDVKKNKKMHRNPSLAGCPPYRSVPSSLKPNQLPVLRSPFAPSPPLHPSAVPVKACSKKKKQERMKRETPVVGHPSPRPAGVGSTPTKSSRHLLGLCKVQRSAAKNNKKTVKAIAVLKIIKSLYCTIESLSRILAR